MRRTGIAIITVLALGLTACGGSDEPAPADQAATGVAPAPETNQGDTEQDPGPADGAVFDFTYLTQGPSTSMTVEIGESLAEGLGSTVDELLIERAVFTPRELDGVEYCAADIALTWKDPNKPEEIASSNQAETDLAEEKSELMTKLLEVFGAATTQEFVSMYDAMQPGTPEAEAFAEAMQHIESGDAGEVSAIAVPANQTLNARGGRPSGAEIVAEWEKELDNYFASEQGEVDSATGLTKVAEALGKRSVEPLADFDTANPESGFYLSDDYQTAVEVGRCARAAVDTDRAFYWQLRTTDTEVAHVEVAVMVDGTVSIADSEVEGMMQDANGMWIAD